MSLEFLEWGSGEAGMSGAADNPSYNYGLPLVRTEPIATSAGDFDPLGVLSKVGSIFGTVAGAVGNFYLGSQQLRAQRDSASIARDNATFERDMQRLQLDTARSTAATNADLARVQLAAQTGLAGGQLELQRAQISGAIGLAQVKGATEVAKAQTELTRARALDTFYAQNPTYAITGVPNTLGGSSMIWLAAIAGAVYLMTRRKT